MRREALRRHAARPARHRERARACAACEADRGPEVGLCAEETRKTDHGYDARAAHHPGRQPPPSAHDGHRGLAAARWITGQTRHRQPLPRPTGRKGRGRGTPPAPTIRQLTTCARPLPAWLTGYRPLRVIILLMGRTAALAQAIPLPLRLGYRRSPLQLNKTPASAAPKRAACAWPASTTSQIVTLFAARSRACSSPGNSAATRCCSRAARPRRGVAANRSWISHRADSWLRCLTTDRGWVEGLGAEEGAT